MTLRFADVSSHNTVLSWGTFLGSLDGLIVKISEGIGYTWSGAANALAQARNAGKCVGAYHFARVNDPVGEADYFLASYAHQPGEVIVLDWEPGMAVPANPDDWAYAWCSRVIAATGVVPWLYLNHYYAAQQSQWPRTRSLGCGLWAAWYGANNGQPLPGMPSFAPWPTAAAWQYTSAGAAPGHVGALDLNLFYGDAAAWRAYGTAGGDMPLTKADIDLWLNSTAYTGGPSISQALKNLDQFAADVVRPDAPGGLVPLRQEIADAKTNTIKLVADVADVQSKLAALDPQAFAAAVVQAVQAMPAADATQVADLVIAQLGQRINTPPAA